MYSIVLMMALGQAPVVTQDTAYYQEPVQSGEPARRGLFRGRFARFRSRGTSPSYYEGGPSVSQPVTPRNMTYQSYYPPPGQAAMPTGPAPAQMVVHLPPGAALTVDGEATKQMSSTRVFITPNLDPGKEYTYELKARVPQPSGELTSIQKVKVRPGQSVEVVMNLPGDMPPTDSSMMTPTRRRILRR